MANLGIVLPVRNRWHTCTQPILTQLAQQGVMESGHKVVVVDDGSTDDTANRVSQDFPNVTLLQGHGTLWWGGAIALGMTYLLKQSSVEAILWLNDDLVLPPNFAENLTTVAQEAIQHQAIIGGLVLADFDPNWIAFSGISQGKPLRDRSNLPNALIPACPLSGNLVILPTKIIQTIGLPDTQYFPHYGCDYQYISGARDAGVPIFISPHLYAQSAYGLEDVIRYLPVWMQWYLQRDMGKKLRLFWQLRSLKFNHNIWAMTNGIYKTQLPVPWWYYERFYGRKILQCLLTLVTPSQRSQAAILAYCHGQGIHPKLIQALQQNYFS